MPKFSLMLTLETTVEAEDEKAAREILYDLPVDLFSVVEGQVDALD